MADRSIYTRILTIAGITVLFLISLQLLGTSFIHLSKDVVSLINLATSNPFIGLFIGLLATAIFQSSSTTTSIAVAAVASGSLSLQQTIPIILGANVGTTITSTIVSMSYLTKTKEFERALAAGTSHDFFNIIMVLLLFPLELKYGILSESCQQMASWIQISPDQVQEKNLPTGLYSQTIEIIGNTVHPFLLFILSIFGIFSSVKLISNFLYKQLIGKSQEKFETIVFSNSIRSFSWGLGLTAIIQSSSITTSIIVPLVATGKVKLKTAFQFILGANLGTTVTAIIAATFKSEAAISLAFAHFLFNFIGVTLFQMTPFLKNLPVYLALKLGRIGLRYKVAGIGYILITFFVLPFSLIYFSSHKKPLIEKFPENESRKEVRMEDN